MSNSTPASQENRRTVGEWLSEPYEWRIPVYQRHYAWNPNEEFGPTNLFWEIVERHANQRLDSKSPNPHYFGAILVENKTGDLARIHNYDVVDGQQRLTTVSVTLFAIIGVASQLNYRQEIQDKLAKYIFIDPDRSERKQPKLVPTNFDQTQFGNLRSAAFDASPSYKDDSEQARRSRVVQACDFFSKKILEFVENEGKDRDGRIDRINVLIETIVDDFEWILIPLKKTDEAQLVFESLNNTARPLTTFDLIRNNVFYRAVQPPTGYPGADEKLFRSPQWGQFEDVFWETAAGKRKDSPPHIESYVLRMLMAEERRMILANRDALYKEYKEFADEKAKNGLNVKSEIDIISKYVDIYKYLVGETKEKPDNAKIDFGYFMHNVCESMDFYPVIFVIANCDATNDEKQRMVFLLESYVIRRYVCKLPTDANNKIAPVICKALGNTPTYNELNIFLNNSQDSETRIFPENEKTEHGCYNNSFSDLRSKLKQYIFFRIAQHTTKESYDEKRDTRGLTIDHIMPQKWRDKEGWKKALEQYEEDHIDRKIHTIGNLTPMSKGLNSGKSNRDWDGPKGAREHLKKCDLKLTRILADESKWDIEKIDARSKELATFICEIWHKDIPNNT